MLFEIVIAVCTVELFVDELSVDVEEQRLSLWRLYPDKQDVQTVPLVHALQFDGQTLQYAEFKYVPIGQVL
jgi:hypothetical protein